MRVAVVGLGFMGTTHAKAWFQVPGACLAAVYSSDATKLTGDLTAIQGNLGTTGEKLDFSEVRKYSDIDQLLQDAEIDAVDVCLPTYLHEPIVLAALRAGKHVLVEKPMALNAEEAHRMVQAAEETGRVLMCAQVLRFFPQYQVLAEMVQSQRLGPVQNAIFRRRCAAPTWGNWLADRSKSGGGMFDLLIHDIDICLHIFGMPQAVSATGAEQLDKGIDVITAQLHYADHPAVVINGGWHHPKSYPFSMEYTLVLEGGTVEYHSGTLPPTLYRADGEAETLPMPEVDAFREELVYFVECCQTGAAPAICPPQESAQAVAVGQWLYESRQRKGERVECKA